MISYFINKVVDLLLFGRIAMAPLTMSVSIIGSISATGTELSTMQILSLGFLGLSCHLFGFGLNDIIDLPIDIKAPSRKKDPLVSGRISITEAWVFVLLQIPIIFLLYLYILKGTCLGVVVLFFSILFSVIYNFWSKKGILPRFIAEFCLASSIGLLSLSSAILFSSTMPNISIFVSILLFFILLSVNSISSGLKDLKSDYFSGASSFIISFGASIISDKKLIIPKKVIYYANFLQLHILIFLFVILILKEMNHLIILFSLSFWTYATVHMNVMLRIKTVIGIKNVGVLLNGYYNYFALVSLFLDILPLAFSVFIVFLFFHPLLNNFKFLKSSNYLYLYFLLLI